MKWRRKKSNASSYDSSYYYASSGPFLISHVLPNSWLTKFKQMSIKPGKKKAKGNEKGKLKSGSVSSPRLPNCGGAGRARFYGGDGDAFWRLSFGDDSADDGEKKRAAFRHGRYGSFSETEFPPSSCRSCRSNAAGKVDTKKLSNAVSGARKTRGLQTEDDDDDDDNVPEIYSCTREKVAEIRTPRMKVEGEKLLRKRSQRVCEEKQLELDGKAKTNDAEELVVKSGMDVREDCRFPSYVSSMNYNQCCSKKIDEGSLFVAEDESDGFSVDNLSSEWPKLKEMKIEEVKSRNEKQRKSLHISRELQRRRPKQNIKVRECSPSTVSRTEICKIKALEDMKKAKLKTMKKKKKKKKKKKRKEKEEKSMEEGLMGLESFAVVKVSMDPQKDFRDSMVEMIQERRISRPEEFEELLACYLTLNSDEYHHLIIKVFRQVWFDLNQACSNPGLQDDQCYYDY